MEDLSESMLELAFQPLKIYLHYNNVYGRQTWEDGELPWGASTHKVTWHFD